MLQERACFCHPNVSTDLFARTYTSQFNLSYSHQNPKTIAICVLSRESDLNKNLSMRPRNSSGVGKFYRINSISYTNLFDSAIHSIVIVNSKDVFCAHNKLYIYSLSILIVDFFEFILRNTEKKEIMIQIIISK